jgi:transcriptional regulator with XRE-family HTH domain
MAMWSTSVDACRYIAFDCAYAKHACLRRLRKERGWTQDDLAAETKVEQAAISLIENGRANPTLLMLENIARALDVAFIELFAAPARQRRPKDR